MEVETDKATVEVEAGHDGHLAEIRFPEGAEVPVGEAVAIVTRQRPTGPPAAAPKPQANWLPSPTPTKVEAAPAGRTAVRTPRA